MIHTVLSVAGSDPGGGAGIQADIKTLSSLKVYGMAVISALTAQNTTGVSGVMAVPAEFVGQQMDAAIADIRPDAVKTGMLANREIVECVAARFRQHQLTRIVVDPVLMSTAGTPLLAADAVPALKLQLAPLALLITPNMGEAETLTGHSVCNLQEMEEACRRLVDFGPRYALVKGGHLAGDAVDVLFDGKAMTHFRSLRVPASNTHGTGCVLSAAIAAYLAKGSSVEESVKRGKQFVEAAIRRGLSIGKGHGPCDPVGIGEP